MIETEDRTREPFARAQAPAPVVESLEHELKFALAPTAVPALRAWLRGAVRPDPEFAHGVVSSIYYDTRDWRLLYEKVNSDYLKTKVRVRWYSPPHSPEQGGRAFLEAKYRIGNRREKVRIPLPETGPELMARGLDDAMLVELPKRLRARGLAVDPTLVPTLLIRYERERWVDLGRACACVARHEHFVSRRVSGRVRASRPGSATNCHSRGQGAFRGDSRNALHHHQSRRATDVVLQVLGVLSAQPAARRVVTEVRGVLCSSN